MRRTEQYEHTRRPGRGRRLGIAAALVLVAFAATPGAAAAGAPAAPGGTAPAAATINCVGCVHHSSYYDGSVWGRAWENCDNVGRNGLQKAYWREYACNHTHNGFGADLKVRWNA